MEEPNLSYIKNLSKGEISFEMEILNVLKEELQDDINSYYDYFDRKNLKQTKLFVHRIKHKMGILGLEKSYEITNRFEKSLSNSDIKDQIYFESMLPIMINFLKTV